MENVIKRNPTVLALQACSELEKLSENIMETVSDVQEWLSAIESYQNSYLSGFKKSNATATLVSNVKENINDLTVLLSLFVCILKEQEHIRVTYPIWSFSEVQILYAFLPKHPS